MNNIRRNAIALVRSITRGLGIDVVRYRPDSSSIARIASIFGSLDIDLVIDIGANKGQFAREIRSGGYTGAIVSFEPLSEAHNHLSDAAKNDSRWHVHDRCAVGSKKGVVQINIAGNSISSSILPMLDTHQSAAPQSAYVSKEQVAVIPLDDVMSAYDDGAKSIFLKVDTQGFEWEVLDGAQATLAKAKGVLMELSLVPLYDGQRLWKEIINRLENAGFFLWAIQPNFSDPISGRTLQVDAIFVRT